MIALQVLIWTFLILLFAGLMVYLVYFIINKVLLNKLVKLMKRYNVLASTVHSINFYKIEILIKSNLPIRIDLADLKKRYGVIAANTNTIFNNLSCIYDELNLMNLKLSSDHIQQVSIEISKNEEYLAKIKAECDKYTEYVDAVDNIAQTYSEVFEILKKFYFNKIKAAKQFKPINDLIATISHTIAKIPSIHDKFDFKKTTNILLDLRKKMQVFVKALDGIVRLQLINDYLAKSINNSQRVINQVYRTIDTKDLTMVSKLIIDYKKHHDQFLKYFLVLDLANATASAVNCCEVAHQISNFVFIHTNTNDLIQVSLQEIDKQTISILSNKDKINDSLNQVSKYFIKDPVVCEMFRQVKKDIDMIDKLASTCKAVSAKTYNQKIDAIKQIASLSKNIYARKEAVKQTIATINDTLANVIEMTSNINDMYIYFWQILAFSKKIAKNDKATEDMEALIHNNLDLLNDYIREIIENSHPNYDKINRNLKNMMQNVDQFANKLKSDATLKSYATNLMVYANRYKDNKHNEKMFAEATTFFKKKKYGECIDTLLSIIKSNRKAM